METLNAQDYIDSNIQPLMINGLSGFDMIDIIKATKLPPSHQDSSPPLNTHIDLISQHITLFEETGLYHPTLWQSIIHPYLSSCLLSYILQKESYKL